MSESDKDMDMDDGGNSQSQPSQEFCSRSQPSSGQSSQAQVQEQATQREVIDVDKEPAEKQGRREKSKVASESAFSTGGRILDDFRTSLTPFMLEAIICAQDWLRRTTPIDIQENMEELSKMEKELIDEFGGLHIAKGRGNCDKNKASTSKSAASMSISKP